MTLEQMIDRGMLIVPLAPVRRCMGCPKHLSIYNPTAFCFTCQRKVLDAEAERIDKIKTPHRLGGSIPAGCGNMNTRRKRLQASSVGRIPMKEMA